jgi:tRNA-splicing ligase RtcB
MKIHVAPNGKTVRIFADDLDALALSQIEAIACLPGIVGDLALMADAHAGKGVPIGTVFATEGLVVPDVISGDIGCGMILMKTNLRKEQLDASRVRVILSKVNRAICKVLKSSANVGDLPAFSSSIEGVVAQNADRAARQLGTLGGGNHFCELQSDAEHNVWVMVHSGSRGLGQAVNGHYHDLAVKLCDRLGATYPGPFAYLPVESEEGQGYLAEQAYCLRYAERNRELIRAAVDEALTEEFADYSVTFCVQTHHNFLSKERWDGRDVYVHRKGAVAAPKGAYLTIPGSMETKSFLCRGTGSALSHASVSHGAGRKRTRGQMKPKVLVKDANGEIFRDNGGYHRVDHAATAVAIREAAAQMVSEMSAKGITLVTNGDESVIDERGHAYKDVDTVIAAQHELLEVVAELTPFGVVKSAS